MKHAFVFYGSLMDSALTSRVCGCDPVKTETGFFHGTLFEVNDRTEPNNIYRYPLAVLGDVSSLIVAKFKVFVLSKCELREMQVRLMDFEGPLYEPKQVEFWGSGNLSKYGWAFVATSEINVEEDSRIQPIAPVANVYSWK